MISQFNIATRSSTNAAGIKLPPIHGAQKGIDPTLKPESQSKSQQTLLKPTLMTPNKRSTTELVRWTPSQSPTKTKATLKDSQKTPVHVQNPASIQTPLSTQTAPKRTCKQTPATDQVITKTPISSAQKASRKLIQKSMEFLNTPRSKPNTSVPLPMKLFPPSQQHDQTNMRLDDSTRSHADKSLHADRNSDTNRHVHVDSSNIPHLKVPMAPIPKILPQQNLLAQENPYDIQSDLIPFQDREVEPIFKTPELDDFLLPSMLGDQITDSTLMHRYLPRPADIDRIMNQIKRKYLTKLQLPCSVRDMQAAYLSSPHFRDIYLSVGMNKLPNTTRSARKLESDLRNAVYMIHGGLLYK